MSLPLTDANGVIQTIGNGNPVVWNNGLGYDINGLLCITTAVSVSDAFIGGKRRDVQGRLVVANSTPAGQPWFYNAGWPSDKNTGATIVQTGTPAPTEPRVAGVAIGPLGGVYMTSGAFSPLDLFKNGEPGFWYDPSDLSTMFQDSAGTIPMQPVGTVADQPVGLILDKSGNNRHASQATSTARPLLSARVNLLTKTEDFADAVWSPIELAPASTSNNLIPSTASSAHMVFYSAGTVTGQQVTARFWIKANGYNTIAFQLSGCTSTPTAFFNCSTGVIISEAGSPAATIELQPDGYYLCEIRGVSAGAGLLMYGYICDLDDATLVFSGDGVKGLLYQKAQLNLGLTALPYQRVNTDADYNAAGFPLYLKFDGVDDSLATASFAMTGTSKATVFSGYANGKTGSTGTLLEFSANYMNNNGSMALLVPSLSTSNVSFGSRGTLGAGEKDSQTAPTGNLEKRVLTAYQDFATINDYGCDFIRAQGIPLANLIGVGNSDVGAGPFGTWPAYIGSRAGTANFMNGQIYSLILAGNGYDEATMALTENWIDGKLHP